MKPFLSNKRGIALLFVLGMLTLLLTLAVAFVAVVQQDRKSSLAGVGSVKAELLVEVAVKRAIQSIEANYMESVSGVPGGVHIRNPRHSTVPGRHLFYNDDGSPKNAFVTSTGSGTNVTTDIQQLLGTYNTGNNDIDNVASGGLNKLMRGNITATGQIPQWLRLGTSDARYCFFANDLSGFANHPVIVDDTVIPPTTNFVPRLPRAFGRDIREIDIPHHPYSHADANFPLGAYYYNGGNSWGNIAVGTLSSYIEPGNNRVLRPIDLNALQIAAVPGTAPLDFQNAFKTMGKEYPTTASQSPITGVDSLLSSATLASTGAPVPLLRRGHIDILYNAFLDYIDADSDSQYADGKGPQTEAHPAINEIGAVAAVEMQSPGPGTNVWKVQLYGTMETHYPYYNAPQGQYTVSAAAVTANLILDGTPKITQGPSAFSETANYDTFGSPANNYVLHHLVTENGASYAEVTYTNASATLDIEYSVSVTAPQISIGGTVVDTVLGATGNNEPIIVAYTNRMASAGAKVLFPPPSGVGIFQKEGGISWSVTDPRFNWHFRPGGGLLANQWKSSTVPGTLVNPGTTPTMGYVLTGLGNLSQPTRQGKINALTFSETATHPTRRFANDRDVGTFVKNAPMETVGELGFLPYTNLKTISLRKRSLENPAGTVSDNGRYHPVWNYFSMKKHQNAQQHYINPNSNHFFYNNGAASQRTTTFVFNEMVVGPTVDPAVTTGGGGSLLQGSTIGPVDAIALANRLADSPAFSTGFQSSPPYAASGSPNNRAYFANVADIPMHMTLASTAAGYNTMKETEIESYHMNSFDLMHTRNNVYALNVLISTTHGLRHVFAEVWRDPFAPQSGGWHDTFPLTISSPSIFD